MAGSTRLELASNSPEGSASNATCPSGQRERENYSGASLDRSGSFRETIENRMLTSGSATSRGGSASVEIPPLPQYLNLKMFSLAGQKFSRFGELRRILGLSPGITSEEQSYGPYLKPLPQGASEELKRFRMSVLDSSIKAKEKVKTLNDLTGKLDKYCHNLFSRKRQQNEISSGERLSGANVLKMGNQIHQPPPDLVTQRLEDRTKNGVPNKRVRTSIAELRSEGRNAAVSRQGVPVEKDGDVVRASNGGSLQVEEKIRGLPTGGEGWEKKMKRKRSVGSVVTRTMDGDRELKRGMQQRLNNDPRSRSGEGHGFRSGSSSGILGINKVDGSSQPSCSSTRATPRNDLENVSISQDRRDRAAGSEKEKATTKGTDRLNLCEDSQVGSSSPANKVKVARALRTGSNVLANSASNFPHTSGALDGWEHPPSSNKVQLMGATNNRKRPVPMGSSSTPVAQWVGQRPQKISRTKRTNLVSPVSTNDESLVLSEGFPAPDIGARLTSVEANGALALGRSILNNPQQIKRKLENIQCQAGVSESEESRAGEKKPKEKGMDNKEIVDRNLNAVQKVGMVVLPAKNKIPLKEEIGDGVRRQGRSGRGSTHARVSMSLLKEKVEKAATTKLDRGAMSGSDKGESKSGRPPTKKLSDRKSSTRPGHVINRRLSEFTGESDDDHEALLAAANSACTASYQACSSSFWKKMEPIFAVVNSEDMTFLKQQISFAEELDESLYSMFTTAHADKVELLCEAPPSQDLKFGERRGGQPNGIGRYQSASTVNSVDGIVDSKLETESWFEKIIPLSQRLLAAFIIEEAEESVKRDASYMFASDGSPCGITGNIHTNETKEMNRTDYDIESEANLKLQKQSCVESFSCNGSTASNNFRSSNVRNISYNDELWQDEDGLGHLEAGVVTQVGQNNLDEAQPLHAHHSGMSSFECNYQQMSLDERILAELHSIGLFPDTVPNLAEGEDEEISKDISKLRKGLYQQVRKKKGQLCRLEKAVQKRLELEERELEQIAMNKLVEMAYKKHMACRGNNSSNKTGVSKISKQATLAFVKRTLARYQKFEDTSRSCFSEPPLRDAIFSAPLNKPDAISAGPAANQYVELRNYQPDSRGSATADKYAPVDKLDRGQLDAFLSLPRSPEQIFSRVEPMLNRGKKREVLLDDVGGISASRAASSQGHTISGGAKGRRSERERDQNKDQSTRSSVAKAGRPSISNSLRGERKTKTKPKQKTAQLSTSGSGLIGRFTEAANPGLSSGLGCSETTSGSSKGNGEALDSFKETEDPIDLTNLPLPGIDSIDDLGVVDALSGQGQDLSSWLNFDADGLQDNDLMGLGIPMDDLNMIL